MKTNKTPNYYVPSSILKLFVGVISLAFILQAIFLTLQGVSQFLRNHHLGGFYGFYFTILLFPLLLFLTAYILNPRSLSAIERSFESIVITLSGIMAWSFIGMVPPYIFLGNGPQYIESYDLFAIIASTVLVVVYGLALYWLRSTKRWR